MANGVNKQIIQVPGTSSINKNYFDFNTTPTGVPTQPGVLSWNSDEDTLDLQANNIVYQIGQEISPLYKNQTGATITNGTPVMFAGSLGASGRIKIQKAIADGSIPAMYTIGIATEDIIDGADGHVTWFGKIRGINTTGSLYGETWADGDILYVSPTTAGYLTKVKPNAPHLQIVVAAVVNAHSTNGTLFTRPTWGFKLEDLDNVNGTALTTSGQIPVWNQSTGYFDFTKNINDYSLTSHNHSGVYEPANANIQTHIASTSNPHSVTKSQVGLGNVANVDTTTTANITDSTDKRFVTDSQQTVLNNTSGTNTGDQTNITGNAGTVTTINGKISAGTNVTLGGTGTDVDPYVINSSGGGGGSSKSKQVEVDFGVITQETNSTKVTVSATDITTTSIIVVTPSGVSTTDHDPEDYQWDNIHAYATNIVNGVGFDLIAYTDNMSWGKYKFNCLYT